MRIFKIFISMVIVIIMMVGMSSICLAAIPPSETTQWEDVFSGATFEATETGVSLSGTGYDADQRFKFGFRNNVAFNVNDASVTVLYPNTFVDFDDAKGHTYYAVSFTNAPVNWIDKVASVNFIIYPISNSQFMISVASNTDSGWGGGTTNNNKVYNIPTNRKMTYSIKKVGSNYSVYVNGEEYDKLNEATTAAVNKFTNGEAFLMFGGIDEKDTGEGKEMSIILTDVTGLISTDPTDAPSTISPIIGASSMPTASALTTSSNTSNKASATKSPVNSSTPVSSASKNGNKNTRTVLILIGVVVVCLGGAATAFIVYKRKVN